MLSSHHRAFSLPKPDQLGAFIMSDSLSLGSGMQRSWDAVPLQYAGDSTPHFCRAWDSGDCSLPMGTGLCLQTAAQGFLEGSSHLLIQNTLPVPLSFLSAYGGVQVGLGCAVLDQHKRAGTVLR